MEARARSRSTALGAVVALVLAVFIVVPSATAISPTGSISGTVSLAAGIPASSMTGLVAVASSDDYADVIGNVDATTGDYTINGLGDGTYTVYFQALPLYGGDTTLLAEYYDDVYSLADATPVAVTGGGDTPGINAELSRTGHFTTLGTPTINVLSPIVGSTLGLNTGSWSPAPEAYSVRWKRNGAPISGAINTTYKITSADLGKTITVTVTATKTGFSSAAKTSAGVVIVKVFTQRATPTITGTGRVGHTLTAHRGTWVPTPTVVYYQWNRNDVPIAGATKSTYKLTSSDRGKKITVTVTGKRSGYWLASKTSAPKSIAW